MLRRILAILGALALLVPGLVLARPATRPATQGVLYLGTAPGASLGGQAPPRALYMDLVHFGYILPSGLDFSVALSGMNFFPDEGDYSLTMGRFTVGYRPLLRDPLPMIQPYAFAGAGVGAEGLYTCREPVDCDPSRDVCTRTCERTRWVGDLFLGLGVDVNAHLFWLGSQQVLFYAGVQGRYEWIFGRYLMPVITFPIGVRLQ